MWFNSRISPAKYVEICANRIYFYSMTPSVEFHNVASSNGEVCITVVLSHITQSANCGCKLRRLVLHCDCSKLKRHQPQITNPMVVWRTLLAELENPPDTTLKSSRLPPPPISNGVGPCGSSLFDLKWGSSDGNEVWVSLCYSSWLRWSFGPPCVAPLDWSEVWVYVGSHVYVPVTGMWIPGHWTIHSLVGSSLLLNYGSHNQSIRHSGTSKQPSNQSNIPVNRHTINRQAIVMYMIHSPTKSQI